MGSILERKSDLKLQDDMDYLNKITTEYSFMNDHMIS